MSRRMLVFASHTLQYRCQAGVRNIGGSYSEQDLRTIRLPDALSRNESMPRLMRGAEIWEARSAWANLVNEYTQRKLSLPSDKLAAFGGVAEEFELEAEAEEEAEVEEEAWSCRILTPWEPREFSNSLVPKGRLPLVAPHRLILSTPLGLR